MMDFYSINTRLQVGHLGNFWIIGSTVGIFSHTLYSHISAISSIFKEMCARGSAVAVFPLSFLSKIRPKTFIQSNVLFLPIYVLPLLNPIVKKVMEAAFSIFYLNLTRKIYQKLAIDYMNLAIFCITFFGSEYLINLLNKKYLGNHPKVIKTAIYINGVYLLFDVVKTVKSSLTLFHLTTFAHALNVPSMSNVLRLVTRYQNGISFGCYFKKVLWNPYEMNVYTKCMGNYSKNLYEIAFGIARASRFLADILLLQGGYDRARGLVNKKAVFLKSCVDIQSKTDLIAHQTAIECLIENQLPLYFPSSLNKLTQQYCERVWGILSRSLKLEFLKTS